MANKWKKVDNRIRVLIENGVSSGHRSMFVVVGEKARDQVVILHHMLSKAEVKARPTVLWCYKKELGFSTHRKKRMRQLKKKIQLGKSALNEDDPFELFVATTNIRYCYYSETQSILGQTFGMVILQDFEALTPNLLARTIETVEGGGLVFILLQSLSSIEQLHSMAMEVHSRYRTEAHQDIVCRFNERFILSLSSCTNCLAVDDRLNVLPISSNAINIKPLPPKHMDDPKTPEEEELLQLKESFKDTPPVGVLVNLCKTADQAKAVLKFVDALSEKTLRTTISMTSARGRGKSAALGFAIAGAIAFNYSNVFVTSPSPENLKTLFSFLLKGFDVLGYEDHIDYEVIQSTNPDFNKAIVRVNVFREHRQTVQYIHPTDANKLGQAELVVIDEAAAIPLPFVKSLFGPYLVFMASTINGYEGTGRSLSLKLLSQLRQQAASMYSSDPKGSSATGRTLHEIVLNESIRYHNGDPVELWLNQLLCLDATVVPRISSGCPEPQQCQLYYINRDTLFSYRKAAEVFLQRLVALFVASHYKNSPNDLLMMADAPAHHLFCLLPPVDKNTKTLPEVLCVLQVCLEGQISKTSVLNELARGKRPFGDMIPWTISREFDDKNFPLLSGARVVRIATHPDYQRMGYGLRALQLLRDYYEGEITMLSDVPTASIAENETKSVSDVKRPSQDNLPPLLLKLSERHPEKLDYVGVSYGLTCDLLKFWKKAGYVAVYLAKSVNDLTGEHSCIMLKAIESSSVESASWLSKFWSDFRQRYIRLLPSVFRNFSYSLALSVLNNTSIQECELQPLTKDEMDYHFTPYDLKRLESYCKNLSDYSLIMDLVPLLAKFYFLKRFEDVALPQVQAAILLCIGLQHRSVDETANNLDLPNSQVLGLFNRTLLKLTKFLTGLVEHRIESTMVSERDVDMQPTEITLDEELAEAAKEIKIQHRTNLEKLKDADFSEYAIGGGEDEWEKALHDRRQTLVSIKSTKKQRITENVFKPEKRKKSFSHKGKKQKRH